MRHKEELPHKWKEPIEVTIYKESGKTDCSNYSRIPMLPTTYKIVSNINVPRLTPYVDETIGDHQCGFRCDINYWSDILHSSGPEGKVGI
jgi:hypothetical protein